MIKNVHDPAILQELKHRIDKLKPDTQRQWGKMDVAQMLAHLNNAMEANLGHKALRQSFIGKIFGRLAKKSITNEAPFKQGLPTAPEFVVADARDFSREKEKLMGLITRLSSSDPEALAKNTHPFFGKMTAQEWNNLNYKHLDHHLRQFGA
jgi:uncharacterized protein DUF1569